jgi:hypothetical protein
MISSLTRQITPVFVPRRKADSSLAQLASLPIGSSILIPTRDRFNAYRHARKLHIKVAARAENEEYDRIWRTA